MNPKDEQTAIQSLRHLRKVLGRVREDDVLEFLARDDQPSEGKDLREDKVHKVVVRITKQIFMADKHLSNAANMLGYLNEYLDPKPGRISSLTDCMRCNQPALPEPKAGLCPECHVEWMTFVTNNKGASRGDFLRYGKIES